MSDLFTNAHLGGTLLAIDARFVYAWWAAENGYTWPDNNNPGNISYGGEGVPSGGVFEGVTSVQENRVCVYDTPEHGIEAWAELIKAPTHAHGGDKILTVDLQDLESCGGNVHCMASKLGNSNWAESHYEGEGAYAYPGGVIVGAYESTVTTAAFAAPAQTTESDNHDPQPVHAPSSPVVGSRTSYSVAEGDTLSALSLRFNVPVDVLARYNNITDPNHIEVGEVLHVPGRYQIRPGDTLSALGARFGESVDRLAAVNRVNPDLIYAGNWLYY